MSDIIKRNYTGGRIKIPTGSKMCLGDRGILEKVLSNQGGLVKREDENNIVFNAPFIDEGDYTGFLKLLSLEFLNHSDIGISHYLDLTNTFEPEFITRKGLVLDTYLNCCKFGNVFYDSILEKFTDAGVRLIRTKVGYDFLVGFEEIPGAVYTLEKYNYISGEVGKMPTNLDFSYIEYLDF